MKTQNTTNFAKIFAAFVFAVSGQASYADTLTFNLDTEFSGGTAPASPTTPWVTATFSDIVGGVQLQISNLNLIGTEFVSGFWFNYSGSTPLASLAFANVSGDQYSDLNGNPMTADGGGLYSVHFAYDTAASNRFTVGESSTYSILGTGVTTSNFNFLSTPSGGNGTWYAAAHVQNTGIDGTGSGFIGAIPEPETYAMLLAGLGLMAFVARRRRQSLGNLVPA